MNRPLLSITFVTMNRSKQLENAINSCLMCNLPSETEFVIVDNASTDNTEEIIKKINSKSDYAFKYYKLERNIGAGKGRNMCFEKSKGYYIYGCDDDAEIDYKTNTNFFMDAIKIFEENKKIATLATQIFDIAWNANRQHINGPKIGNDLYICKMFSGGSHFLRKDFFNYPPYLNNSYGYEELPPSLLVIDNGGINAFCPNLLAIHKPRVNKWDFNKKINKKYLIIECAAPYAIKKMMYPIFSRPFVYIAHLIRCKRYLDKKDIHEEKILVNEMINKYSLDRIKNMSLIKLFYYFGFSIF